MVTFADVIGPKLARRIREHAPRGKGPKAGRLADSTRYTRQTRIGVVRMEFHSNVPYAPFVIRGTKAHDIVPKAAKVLHWTAPGGMGVFARRVHHPGTKPNPYPRAALNAMMPQLAAQWRATFERL
jgi:hypothetical protein